MIGPHTCERCGSGSVRVADSRPQATKSYRKRRIVCDNCQHRWSTFEIHQMTFDLLSTLKELWEKMKTSSDTIANAVEDCKEVIEQHFNGEEHDEKREEKTS